MKCHGANLNQTIEQVQSFEKQLLHRNFYKKMAEYLVYKTCPKDTKDVKKVTKKWQRMRRQIIKYRKLEYYQHYVILYPP